MAFPPSSSSNAPSLDIAPHALAAEVHDLGHLLRESLRTLEHIQTKLSPPTSLQSPIQTDLSRLTRLLSLAQDHCDGLLQGAAILQHPTQRPIKFAEINLASLATHELSLWRDHSTASALTLTLQGSASPVRADPALLTRAIRNLLLNAIAHSTPDSAISVTLRAASPHSTSIAVSNHGRPPSPDVVARLSAPSSSAPIASGVGLIVVALIADIHQGSLRVTHDAGLTTFTLTIENNI